MATFTSTMATYPLSSERARQACDELSQAVRSLRNAAGGAQERSVLLQRIEPVIRRFAARMRAADVPLRQTAAALLHCLEDGGFARPHADGYDWIAHELLGWALDSYDGH